MKNVVMIDLDGVVLNENYKTTKEIHSTIKKLENSALVVPNSDTPINRLKRLFLDSVGLTPEVTIGEKGAIIDFFGTIFLTRCVPQIYEYRKEVVKTFNKIGGKVLESEYPIHAKRYQKFSPGEKIIIVDNSRQASISIFFFKAGNTGNLEVDNKWTEFCSGILSQIDLPEGLDEYEYNYKYGVAISNAINSSKTLGVQFLKKELDPANYFMIGDSASDIIQDNKVLHLAVGNADDDLILVSDFVANKKYTEGLEECLEWILKF